jgi:hypothetical protein
MAALSLLLLAGGFFTTARATANCTAQGDCLQVNCPAGTNHSWTIGLLWFDATQPAFQSYFATLVQAVGILGQFGTLLSTDVLRPHVTIEYFCCKTPQELQTIATVLENTPWQPFNASFDALVCNDDQHNGANTTSLVVRLDAASQTAFGASVRAFEDAIIAAGVKITHRRAQQEFFHSTVAVVLREPAFPVEKALRTVNAKIANWTGSHGPIVIRRLLMLDPFVILNSS